jgi:hypothetical protein
MPNGKPAGVRCVHLTPLNLCAIYGHADRPEICGRLRASVEMCGTTAADALSYLAQLELDTLP